MKSLAYGKEELDYLGKKDPVLNSLIEEFGHIQIDLSEDVFTDIVYAIVGQMLSLKAGETISKSLREKAEEINPHSLAKLRWQDYRSCGLSRAKAEYIKGFAIKVNSNELDLSLLKSMSSEDIIKTLSSIKGIGTWTAEMIALFTLGEKDIFSFGDTALKNGIMAAHGYRTLSKKRFEKLRRFYSPYCSIASLYYYRYNDTYVRKIRD